MRISDWSSDVCSSDLFDEGSAIQLLDGLKKRGVLRSADQDGITVWMRNIDGVQEEALADVAASQPLVQVEAFAETSETTDLAEILRSEERLVGKECVSSVDLGGSRILKKKK